MALKDLIADKDTLDEAAIEQIIAAYVRYDIEEHSIIPTPAFGDLSNRAKILVYLIAVQGWKFVVDDPVPSDARPVDIENATGIPGGSVRPILRELSDTRILAEKNGQYSVRSTAFANIQRELSGNQTAPAPRRARSARRQKRSDQPPANTKVDEEAADEDISEAEGATGKGRAKRTRRAVGKTHDLGERFSRLIDDSFFDEPKTAKDVREHFRKNAVQVRPTSLPWYFIQAVQDQRLTREEIEEKGRKVWAY